MVDNIEQRKVIPLSNEVWRKDSIWFRRAIAYRLLHALIPAEISRRLPRILSGPFVYPGVEVPEDAELPPGTVLPPGAEFPPGWFPGDPLPPVVIPAPVVPPVESPIPPPYIGPGPGAPLPVKPPSPPVGAAQIQEDEFNDASIAAFWTQLVQTGGAFSEAGTQLTIQSSEESVVAPNPYKPHWIYLDALAGDFDVKAKFDSWTAATNNDQEAGLFCEIDEDNWTSVGADRTFGDKLAVCHRVASSYRVKEIAHPGWPVYLRTYRTAGVFTTQYSTDGNTWIDLLPVAGGLDNTGDVKIGLRANDNWTTIFNALFDWIRNT